MDNNNKDGKEVSTNPETKEVIFKYLKSNFYRVVHANGAIGGLSGRGEIHIGFYSERLEFPDSSKLLISPEGQIGDEQIDGSGKHVREIEVDVIVDLNTAKEVRAWLDGQISSIETLIRKGKQEADNRAKEITIPEG